MTLRLYLLNTSIVCKNEIITMSKHLYTKIVFLKIFNHAQKNIMSLKIVLNFQNSKLKIKGLMKQV